MSDYKIYNQNNMQLLAAMADGSLHAVVTDCPYGFGKEPDAAETLKAWLDTGYHEITGGGFMGKKWDAFVPQPLFWKEVLRVLKPGGYVLAFFGTRTYDWGTLAIRLAGFEIRDCIQWIYGSGFPKSHDVSKAIDRQAGAEREVVGVSPRHTSKVDNTQSHVMGKFVSKDWNQETGKTLLTAPATPEAQQWQGYGTALKPACEIICVARKPLEGTVADNVLKHGCGAINLDGCRIATNDNLNGGQYSGKTREDGNIYGKHKYSTPEEYAQPLGRFPANVIFDEEAAKVLDEQSGVSSSKRNEKPSEALNGNTWGGTIQTNRGARGHTDSGGASRFFKTIPTEKHCELCNNTNAQNAELNLAALNATIQSTAPQNATPTVSEQSVLLVKSVGSLCDSCAISFVHEVVKINSKPDLQFEAIQGFIRSSKKCTLLLSLAQFVEQMASIDTTPTTINLSRLFGYVLHAIEEHIKKDIKERGAQRLEQSQFIYQAKASKADRNYGCEGFEEKPSAALEDRPTKVTNPENWKNASVPNARVTMNRNNHPTVKPIKLMRYLVRLVKTPVDGFAIADFFMGSGTTGVACMMEDIDFIGCDEDESSYKIAEARIAHAKAEQKPEVQIIKPQQDLFKNQE